MPRRNRIEQFDPREVGILFVTQRCVRRAFLTGFDPVSGVDYSYRKEMIRKRMESLSSVFGIEVLTYAILSNHMHLVIRNRPDIVANWNDRIAAEHWLRIFPGKRIDQDLGVPSSTDIDALVANEERLKILRIRLSDPSWYMKSLSETIARRCNQADQATGHFWEGRFKAQAILDETSLLACSMYVDLNPIRAKMSETIETSEFTSAYDRIQTLQGKTIESAALDTPLLTQGEVAKVMQDTAVENLQKLKRKNQRGKRRRVAPDAWLAPVQMLDKRPRQQEGQASYVDLQPSPSGLRPSDRGFLSFSVQEYLLLLEWAAKQPGREDQGVMSDKQANLIDRLGVDPAVWSDLVSNFSRYYAHSGAIGTADSLRREAERRRRSHYQAERQLAASPPGAAGKLAKATDSVATTPPSPSPPPPVVS